MGFRHLTSALSSGRANAEQRIALLTILSGQAGNAWFEFLASTVGTAYDPQFVPIEFEFDKKKRRARVVIPSALETVSGLLLLPNTKQENRVTVRLPEGREYLEMEVAQAIVLKGTGAIKSTIEILIAAWPRSSTRTKV